MTTREILDSIQGWPKEELQNLSNHINWLISDIEDEESRN